MDLDIITPIIRVIITDILIIQITETPTMAKEQPQAADRIDMPHRLRFPIARREG